MRTKFDILGVKISVTNLEDACEFIETRIPEKASAYVCIAPVATIVDCQKDEEYLHVVNHSAMTTPDGMPIVWLGKLKGNKSIRRTYGPDLLMKFCELSCDKGYKHYFYGGTEDSNRLVEENLKKKFPNLNIVGRYSPPFRPNKKGREDVQKIKEINALNPDVLWVGLGSPKQDFWMHQHQSQLKVGVMIGVGAAFDFIAGTKRQAPRWMQKIGLEWFFRLCSEPKRLWKRYLIGNTQFIYYLITKFLIKR